MRLTLIFILALCLAACSAPSKKQQALHEKQKAAQIYVQLGYTYLKEKKYTRAKQKLLQAEALFPDNSEVHSALGYYFQAVGEKQLAHHHYLTAINLSDQSGESLNNYGTFLCHIGRREEAINYFVKAAETKSYLKSGSAYENAGVCAELAGKSTAAEFYFNKALTHEPGKASVLLALSKIKSAQKRYQEANHYLQKFFQVSNPSEQSLELGMQVSAGLKDYKALRYFSDELRKYKN